MNACACVFLVYMLPPLPRRSDWVPILLNPPSRINLPRKGYRVGPRIVLFEACSAFTHVAACTLALSPVRDMHFPKASGSAPQYRTIGKHQSSSALDLFRPAAKAGLGA